LIIYHLHICGWRLRMDLGTSMHRLTAMLYPVKALAVSGYTTKRWITRIRIMPGLWWVQAKQVSKRG